jgi:predicted Rdx family selenoprotein
MTRRQFAQELLSTFGTALGEVALQPSTGGTFIVSLYVSVPLNEGDIRVQHHVLWDRNAEGGFPGTSFSAILYVCGKIAARMVGRLSAGIYFQHVSV